MCKAVVSQLRKDYGSISSTDEKRIKEAAKLLLDNLFPDANGQYPYPLPVVSMLNNLGFSLFRARFENPKQSGLIVVDSSLPEQNRLFRTDRAVLVNRDDSTAHQRFTVAHEIAHYIFDYNEETQPTYYKEYLTTENGDEVELRANRFAAELLMPTDDFVKELKKYKRENSAQFSLPNLITHLSKFFDVPVTAVRIRMDETEKYCGEGS